MAQVFLSYDREDVARARPIAATLEQAGHTVWWDRHIRGGTQFAKEIERALDAAEAVVVLWSRQGVESAWVRDEAASGRDRGRLVPVSLDGTIAPLGFRQFQTIDFSRKTGRAKAEQSQTLLEAIDAVVAADGDSPARPAARSDPPRNRRRLAYAAAALVVLALAIAAVALKPWARAAPTTVAVVAANNASTSRAYARDLLAQLGELQAAKPNSLQLSDDANGKNAALKFTVAGEATGQQLRVNLILLERGSGALLWSKSFTGTDDAVGDLFQQMGYNAAQVLDCVDEAHRATGSATGIETLRPYLSACAAYADRTPESLPSLIQTFRRLTATTPAFAPAWAKLLLVEGEFARLVYLPAASGTAKAIPADIAAARKVDPTMPEASLAEAALLADTAFEQRIGLLEKALVTDPDNSGVLRYLIDQFRFVGRNNDAVEMAKRAVAADPLSPINRQNLVGALIYAGNINAARAEIDKLERIWPRARNIAGARFALELRYGDAKEALRMLQSGAVPMNRLPYLESFLKARIDPTPANVERTVSDATNWYRSTPTTIYHLEQVLGTFGRTEDVFKILLNWSHPELVSYVADGLYRPALSKVHRDPRMIAVAKKMKMLDYWQSTGIWPDFCSDPDLPYDCKAEAAKLAKAS